MRKKAAWLVLIASCALSLTACKKDAGIATDSMANQAQEIVSSANNEASTGETETAAEEKKMNYTKLFNEIELNDCYKGLTYNNPLISQEFGADPYAMVYGDTLYIYMTQDAIERDDAGNVKENSYGKIQTIRVISTKDMVNWTDNGEIKVAGEKGAAKWARNSWAPAVCWKNIDGKDKFFLYFADSGNGIGVVTADSPIGPFTDPIGHGLITRDIPNCADVLWLFDPAVLVDDDGTGYIYFGGGVPEGQAPHPMTGRCAKLTDDMIGIDGEVVRMDTPYLFEDSGIHKFNNKYYYTYCTNWNVDQAGTAEYGFVNGEIAMMESDNPLGPFTYKETILKNPGHYFGLGGNNHHCVFNFNNQWYMTYHCRVLEQKMGFEKGYRCTFIDAFDIAEDGSIGNIAETLTGVSNIKCLNPYEKVNACTFSHQAGFKVIPSDEMAEAAGSGIMALSGIDSGDFFKVSNVDFGHKSPTQISFEVRKTQNLTEDCVIELRLDSKKGDVIGYVPVGELMKDAPNKEFTEITADLKVAPTGEHSIYMIFSGKNYQLLSWQFGGDMTDWYEGMINDGLVSAGTNGRLESVLKRMSEGETVNVGFLGGSITEGALADVNENSYSDLVVKGLEEMYPQATVNYVNAGLSGTPSSLGIMRYERDIVEAFGTEPDILFVEFSVNDYQECTDTRAYEALVRQALLDNEKTAVVLVFSVAKSKWNMQEVEIPVGEYYGVPMISVRNAIVAPFADKKMTDADYFADDYHPNNFGHEIMAKCILNAFEVAANSNITEVSKVPEKALLGDDFTHGKLVTSANLCGATISVGGFGATDTVMHSYMRFNRPAFPDNWMHEAGADGSFTMTLNCKTLLINYKKSKEENAGKVKVYVDGKEVKEIDSFDGAAWGQSIADLLIDEKEAMEHTVTIEMVDNSKAFTIFAFAYTE